MLLHYETGRQHIYFVPCSWLGSSRAFASDLLPYVRAIASQPQRQHASQLLPKIWCQVHNGVLSQHRPHNMLHGGLLGDSANMAGLSLADAELEDEIDESD